MNRRRAAQRDEGVFSILYALLGLVLLAVCAYIVDISLLRTDRRVDRQAADSAAAGGASDIGDVGAYTPRTACLTAWQLALDNLGKTTGSINCDEFPTDAAAAACGTGSLGNVVVGRSSNFTIKITWPVRDGDPLMTRPDHLLPTDQTVDPAHDGAQCARLGVSITAARTLPFASALGSGNGATTSRSVAKFTASPGSGDTAIPLVVLDKNSCGTLKTAGNTRIVVNANGTTPGRIGVDSDGSSPASAATRCTGGGGNDLVVRTSSNNSIYALDSTSGARARIYSYATFVQNSRAFDTGGTTCPDTVHATTTAALSAYSLCVRPEAYPSRIGRSSFDKTFGCLAATGTCASSSTVNYIQQYASVAARSTAPPGFTNIAAPDPICQNGGSGVASGLLTVRTGNLWITCDVKINGYLAFANSQVIFTKNLVVQGGCLLFNQPVTLALNVTTAATLCNGTQVPPPNVNLTQEAVVFIKGDFGVTGSLYAPQTTIIQPSGRIGINNNLLSHTTWSAPFGTAGACTAGNGSTSLPTSACFKNLALWNDGAASDSAPDTIKGASSPVVDGAFFLPNARVEINGNTSNKVTRAQVYAGRFTAVGGGQLILAPDPNRSISEPLYRSELIR